MGRVEHTCFYGCKRSVAAIRMSSLRMLQEMCVIYFGSLESNHRILLATRKSLLVIKLGTDNQQTVHRRAKALRSFSCY